MKKQLIVLILLLNFTQLNAQKHSLYEKHVFEHELGNLPFRLLLPENYDPTKEYPLIYFLHGAGERGDDNEKQLTHGGDYFTTDSFRVKFPAIVVFPQCPSDGYWIGYSVRERIRNKSTVTFDEVFEKPINEQVLLKGLLEHIQLNYKIDRNRQYVMGLSMGAMGLLEMLARWPDEFAAAISICGGGSLKAAKNYANKVSIFLTHGVLDDVIPVHFSRDLLYTLMDLEADVEYIEFDEVYHNAWEPTFSIPDLMPWLFDRSKN